MSSVSETRGGRRNSRSSANLESAGRNRGRRWKLDVVGETRGDRRNSRPHYLMTELSVHQLSGL